MKLHDIVELKGLLKDAYPVEEINASLDAIINNMSIIQHKYNEDYNYRIGEVIKTIQQLKEEIKSPLPQLDDISEIIRKDLEDATAKFRLPDYQSELFYANPARIREIRNMYIPTGVDEIVRRSIDMYVDWKYPGLEIGCRDGEFTKYIVGCDPLYITDVFQEFIDNTKNQYPMEYQRRIRPYLINDMKLTGLPEGQFGFIFSWNFFNYLSMNNIYSYLEQSMRLLRPGGTIMFSYNNADMPAAAAYADSYFMSYAPRSQLEPMCRQLGYEILSGIDLEPAVSWLELRKPGELKMIKSHQVLGQIKYVSP